MTTFYVHELPFLPKIERVSQRYIENENDKMRIKVFQENSLAATKSSVILHEVLVANTKRPCEDVLI